MKATSLLVGRRGLAMARTVLAACVGGRLGG
jgi:hypothetical protein